MRYIYCLYTSLNEVQLEILRKKKGKNIILHIYQKISQQCDQTYKYKSM